MTRGPCFNEPGLGETSEPQGPTTRMSSFEEKAAREHDAAWLAMEPSLPVGQHPEQWTHERLADAYFAACYDRRGLIRTLDIERAALAEAEQRVIEAEARAAAPPDIDVERRAVVGEVAWGIIANAGGGDWTKESPDWQAAAVRWRDEYMPTISTALAVSRSEDMDR